MARSFRIDITHERRTTRNRILELKIHPEGSEEPFLALATLYGTELYLNLPANSQADALIGWLSIHVGEPAGTPVIKCSAPWNDTMIGAMQTALWTLSPEALEHFDLLLTRSTERT